MITRPGVLLAGGVGLLMAHPLLRGPAAATMSRVAAFATSSPRVALSLGVASFLFAVFIGAYRKVFIQFLSRILPIHAFEEHGAQSRRPVRKLPLRICFSPTFRIAVWGVVTGSAIASALIAAAFLYRTVEAGHTDVAYFAFLATAATVIAGRLALSTALARWVMNAGLVRNTLGSGPHFLEGHTANVHKLLLSGDGHRLATFGVDGVIRLWNTRTAQELGTFRGAESVMYRKTKQASTEGRPGIAYVDKRRAFALSADGRWIAAATDDRTVSVWDTVSGEPRAFLRDHPDLPMACAITADGRLGATSCEKPAGVRIWDLASGRPIRTLICPAYASELAFSPDGQWLAAGGDRKDSSVRLWEVATGVQVHALDLRDDDHIAEERASWRARNPHYPAPDSIGRSWAEALAFSPDSRLLAVASDLSTLWDVATGSRVRKIEHPYERVKVRGGFGGPSGGVAFNGDGRLLATAHLGRPEAAVWETATGRIVHATIGWRCEAKVGEIPAAVAFSADGHLVFANKCGPTGEHKKSTVWLWKFLLPDPGRRDQAE